MRMQTTAINRNEIEYNYDLKGMYESYIEFEEQNEETDEESYGKDLAIFSRVGADSTPFPKHHTSPTELPG